MALPMHEGEGGPPERAIMPGAPDNQDQSALPPSEPVVATATIAGANVEYVLEIPKNPTDDTVNVIMYGFAGSEPVYRALAQTLAEEHGLFTLRARLARRQPIGAALDLRQLKDATRLSSKCYYGAIKQLSEHDLDPQVNLLSHSLSGRTATNLARHKPGLVKNLVLASSAGLIDHSLVSLIPNTPRLGWRLLKDVGRLRGLGLSPRDLGECVGHIVVNPILTLGEMIVAAHCDIREALDDLPADTKLAFLQLEEDELFKLEEVEAQVGGKSDHFRVIRNLGHGGLITHPDEVASEYAQLIRDMGQPPSLTVV